jgi:hypothetical protein
MPKRNLLLRRKIMARVTCEPGRSVDVWAKEYFGGKCPYTGKECESLECSRCQVEKNEKEWMEEMEEEE